MYKSIAITIGLALVLIAVISAIPVVQQETYPKVLVVVVRRVALAGLVPTRLQNSING
jgi:hypothetical protein